MVYLHSLQSEWIKTKRSTAFWLCVVGGFFIPLLFMIGFFVKGVTINKFGPPMWYVLHNQLWETMVNFLLPMGIILAASLIAQLEYKNNTWKQVFTTPQTLATVFFAKLSAILLMTVQFFLFFNIGFILTAVLPTLFIDGSLPNESLPVWDLVKANGKIFITTLPIIGIQYLISLRFKNFMVSIGIGLLGLIGSLILVNFWKYAYVLPYTYTLYNTFAQAKENLPTNMYIMSGIVFAVLTAANYIIYLYRSEKG